MINSYLETLNNQSLLFSMLLELAYSKQPIIINGEVEKLEIITKKEQEIIIQVGRLEEKRNSLNQAMANYFCVLPEELNAEKLITLIKASDKEKLEDINKNLQKTLLELETINGENTTLIEQSLELVNFSINLMTGYDDNPTYSEKDEASNRSLSRVFDHKI